MEKNATPQLATDEDRNIFAGEVFGYHLVNVAVHALNSVLLVALLLRSRLPAAVALLGGLVFAVHPANVEAVAWISQLKTNGALALTLVASCGGGDTVPGADPGPSVAFEKYELAIGLDVILHVDPSDPIAGVAMTFHVGSAREVEGKTGFAHLFEHLMFEGSKHHNHSHFDPLQRVGATLNGSIMPPCYVCSTADLRRTGTSRGSLDQDIGTRYST